VNPAGLAAGTYSGTITVTAPSAGNSPQILTVALVVSLPGAPAPTNVVNAASQLPGAVAPGEIISIYGSNLGPITGVGPTINGQTVATSVAGVTVSFDNIPAPLLYVSARQVNAVVPFELAGRAQTQMVVQFDTVNSTELTLNVTDTDPGLFTVTENGTGQGAILNSNFSVNSSTNPAAPGSYIVLYGTGGGETSPAGVDGNITPNNGTGLKDILGVTVTVGSLPCNVGYAGTAPGFVEGAMQINCQLADTVPSGSQPVVVTIANISSPSTVTVAIGQ
jgi:uncharacterized protein (TIGR03437 family)